MVQNGTKEFTVPKGLEGNKYRTAMGLRGKTLGIIVTEKPVPMDVVANKFVTEKYEFAINLDGGSSSSYVTLSATGSGGVADSVEWDNVLDTPTTVEGYGITDAMEKIPVTADDDGKFMRVANGQWAAVDVANANGKSF